MNHELIERKFEEIGARVKFGHLGRFRSDDTRLPVRINIAKDNKGEIFTINKSDMISSSDIDLKVIDINSDQRHLLLQLVDKKSKIKILCGHDERQWFVAGIPDKASVKNVFDAMESLKPSVVADNQNGKLSPKELKKPSKRRRNKVYIRQGEWFFTPAKITVDPKLIHKNEPLIARRGSKPHTCEELYRTGGTIVQVHRIHAPLGITLNEFEKLSNNSKNAIGWRQMIRDAIVYVRGSVRHADHATVYLPSWYRVQLNREAESKASNAIAFLD